MARPRKPRHWGRRKKSDWNRTCPSGKVGFRHKAEALASDGNKRVGGKLLAYRCSECWEWHLADPVGRKERRRRAARGEF